MIMNENRLDNITDCIWLLWCYSIMELGWTLLQKNCTKLGTVLEILVLQDVSREKSREMSRLAALWETCEISRLEALRDGLSHISQNHCRDLARQNSLLWEYKTHIIIIISPNESHTIPHTHNLAQQFVSPIHDPKESPKRQAHDDDHRRRVDVSTATS